jgi:iron uptake system component EfeO
VSLPRTRRMSTLSLGVAAAVLAGCSSGTTASDERLSSSPAGDAYTAIVVITSDKCVADRASYDAGGITFKVSNKDATGITEFESCSTAYGFWARRRTSRPGSPDRSRSA